MYGEGGGKNIFTILSFGVSTALTRNVSEREFLTVGCGGLIGLRGCSEEGLGDSECGML